MAFVVKLKPALDRAVAVLAARFGCSKNEIIEQAVEQFLWNNLAVGDEKDE
jgi:predicted transcriptional regulator